MALNKAMERASLGGKTWAEEERERVAEQERLEGKAGSLTEGRARAGRFGHLMEVGVRSFDRALDEDRNTWVVVHIYDPVRASAGAFSVSQRIADIGLCSRLTAAQLSTIPSRAWRARTLPQNSCAREPGRSASRPHATRRLRDPRTSRPSLSHAGRHDRSSYQGDTPGMVTMTTTPMETTTVMTAVGKRAQMMDGKMTMWIRTCFLLFWHITVAC